MNGGIDSAGWSALHGERDGVLNVDGMYAGLVGLYRGVFSSAGVIVTHNAAVDMACGEMEGWDVIRPENSGTSEFWNSGIRKFRISVAF